MPATSVDLRSEREAPDRTAQQSYREELERQMCEKKAWREREKKEIEAYELKADLKVKQDLAEQEAKAAGPGAARAADKGKENSTRPAPDRTAEQSWREELERQVYEKKVRLEHEKKEIEDGNNIGRKEGVDGRDIGGGDDEGTLEEADR